MALPRLCFLSYPAIRRLAQPVVDEFRRLADIEVVDGSFEQALAIARDRLASGRVDVFVSAGSNASLLKQHVRVPVATIPLGGFDILQALISQRGSAHRVGVVLFRHPLPELEQIKHLLKLEVRQATYTDPADARAAIALLQAEGVRVIVGSSLVVAMAQEAGLEGLLAYSLASIRQGFEDALELARMARLEASRHEALNSVLHHLHDAVLAVDQGGQITAANPVMHSALGTPALSLIGRPLADWLPEAPMRTVLAQGGTPPAEVLRLDGRDWVAQWRPIAEQGQITGAALTLYDAQTIHEADNRLRQRQRQQQRQQARYRFDDLQGSSPAFTAAVAAAQRYARTDQGLLLTGESGTGKELFAQAIHAAGPRARRPFVAFNCAAFPESLLESELFGYEDGAFTGARRGGRRGLFEAAHTGTLFLDEIGDMPLQLQTRLLRVLQEAEIQRVGANTPVPINVRVIAATHQPLAQRVAAGQFRQDLFYRLQVLQLALPPLRARRADIPSLALHLLRQGLTRLGSPADAAAVLAPHGQRLQALPWPGNVRQLQNLMERLATAVHTAPPQPGASALPPAELLAQDCPELAGGLPPETGLQPAAERPATLQTRQALAQQALQRCGDRPGAAAQALGISRATLWRWLRAGQAPAAPG